MIKFYFPGTSVPYWFFLSVEKTFTWLYNLEQNLIILNVSKKHLRWIVGMKQIKFQTLTAFLSF